MVSPALNLNLTQIMNMCSLDVVRAMSEAIDIVTANKHDPIRAHERVRSFYNWGDVAERTEKVYDTVVQQEPYDFWTRMRRYVFYPIDQPI